MAYRALLHYVGVVIDMKCAQLRRGIIKADWIQPASVARMAFRTQILFRICLKLRGVACETKHI